MSHEHEIKECSGDLTYGLTHLLCVLNKTATGVAESLRLLVDEDDPNGVALFDLDVIDRLTFATKLAKTLFTNATHDAEKFNLPYTTVDGEVVLKDYVVEEQHTINRGGGRSDGSMCAYMDDLLQAGVVMYAHKGGKHGYFTMPGRGDVDGGQKGSFEYVTKQFGIKYAEAVGRLA